MMRHRGYVAVIVIVLSLTLPGMGQASSYGGHYYGLTPTPATWFNAEALAVALDAHLVTINSAAEEILLKSTFGEKTFFWIGFTDRPVEGNWHWTSGEPVTYTNWAPFEPNDSQAYYYNGERGEDCGQMNFVNDYGLGWNDLAGNQWLSGIIESSKPLPPSIPLPGSLLLLGSGLLYLIGSRWRLG